MATLRNHTGRGVGPADALCGALKESANNVAAQYPLAGAREGLHD